MPGRAATFDPPFPNHYVMHGSGKFGLAGLCNLDQLPPTGASRDRGAAEDRERVGKPAAGDCDHDVARSALSTQHSQFNPGGFTTPTMVRLSPQPTEKLGGKALDNL